MISSSVISEGQAVRRSRIQMVKSPGDTMVLWPTDMIAILSTMSRRAMWSTS